MLEELRIRILVFEPWGSASNPFSGRKKFEKTKNAQNEILDVRKFGQKVVNMTLGPS